MIKNDCTQKIVYLLILRMWNGLNNDYFLFSCAASLVFYSVCARQKNGITKNRCRIWTNAWLVVWAIGVWIEAFAINLIWIYMRIFRHRNETTERQIRFFPVFRVFITFGILTKHPKMKQFPLFMLQIVSDCWFFWWSGVFGWILCARIILNWTLFCVQYSSWTYKR